MEASFSNLRFNLADPARCAMVWQIQSYRASFAEFEGAKESVERSAFPNANWDGYGALPISTETKANALGALSRLETIPTPEISANPNGTLSFEWETSQGFGQLEIGRTRYSFYVQPNGGRAFFDKGDANRISPAVGVLVDSLLYPKPSASITKPLPNV